jgi:Na+/H+-dicarboxylate symporter
MNTLLFGWGVLLCPIFKSYGASFLKGYRLDIIPWLFTTNIPSGVVKISSSRQLARWEVKTDF